MGSMNIFRLSGDICHLLSIVLLYRRLYTSRNAQGISLRTQELFLLVSLTRYTDLFTTFYSLYTSFMKMFYIISKGCIVYMIRKKEPICSTYDREQDSFPHLKFAVAPSAILAIALVYGDGYYFYDDPFFYSQVLWVFSIVLESLAILPQLSLLRRYRFIENLTGNYVFFMGSYRFLYIINWVYRANVEPGYQHHILVYIAGGLQVFFYVEFFYYYVQCKLRGKALRYGGEGDTEYYDCNVDGLRNDENSSPLILGDSDNNDLRMRGRQDIGDSDETSLLVV